MPSIAQIWKGGCIIRSKLLSKIQDAYNKDPNLKNLIFDDWFNNEIATRLDNLANVVSLSTKAGIPVPCLSSTLDYLNSYRTNRLPQNLVQAMRDCFGSHTYERIDKEKVKLYDHRLQDLIKLNQRMEGLIRIFQVI